MPHRFPRNRDGCSAVATQGEGSVSGVPTAMRQGKPIFLTDLPMRALGPEVALPHVSTATPVSAVLTTVSAS